MDVVIDQESVNYGPQAKPGPLPGFVNKVLVDHSQGHSFTYFLGYFCTATVGLSSYAEIHPIEYLTLYRGRSLTAGIDSSIVGGTAASMTSS